MKNKILFSAMLFVACMLSMNLNAQLKVLNNGNVGINSSNPLSTLSIGGAGLSNAKLHVHGLGQYNTGDGDQYGIYSSLSYGQTTGYKCAIYGISQAFSSSVIGVKGEALPINPNHRNVNTFGVYGRAGNGIYGKNYGVFGSLQNGDAYGTGIYGTNNDTIQPLSGRYAGYFRGMTEINGTLYYTQSQQTSDVRLKKNIVDVKSEVLSKFKDLRPVQFQWQQVEDVFIEDTVTIKTPHFSSDVDFERKHYGFLAQDVQKLFPELVQEDGNGYLSVNYIELIPLLIQSLQDLSIEVDALKAQLNK